MLATADDTDRRSKRGIARACDLLCLPACVECRGSDECAFSVRMKTNNDGVSLHSTYVQNTACSSTSCLSFVALFLRIASIVSLGRHAQAHRVCRPPPTVLVSAFITKSSHIAGTTTSHIAGGNQGLRLTLRYGYGDWAALGAALLLRAAACWRGTAPYNLTYYI